MKTNLEKLTLLLCSVEEIRKNIQYTNNITWKPWYYKLEDYHLRMYCEIKNIDVFEIKWLLLDWTEYKTFKKMPIICRLEAKPFHLQKEEIFWKIFYFLNRKVNE